MLAIFVYFVLFDARGEMPIGFSPVLLPIATALLLAIKYIPEAIHRPKMVEALCDDALAIAAHASFAIILHDPLLQYAYALCSVCCLVEHRFSTLPALTALALIMVAAYTHGPRISDLRSFLIATGLPTVAECLAKALAYVERVAVAWIRTGGMLSSD